MELFRNSKGGMNLRFDGYDYTKKNVRPNRTRWECSRRQSMDCVGAVITDSNITHVYSRTPHNHGALPTVSSHPVNCQRGGGKSLDKEEEEEDIFDDTSDEEGSDEDENEEDFKDIGEDDAGSDADDDDEDEDDEGSTKDDDGDDDEDDEGSDEGDDVDDDEEEEEEKEEDEEEEKDDEDESSEGGNEQDSARKDGQICFDVCVENLCLLNALCRMKPTVAKEALKNASSDLINALSECSLHVLEGYVPLTPLQKKRLARNKHGLRVLAKKHSSVKRRKQVLQKGGFLGALIKPIVAVLGELLGGF